MKTQIAKALNRINVEFYNQCAESFSATRHSSWAGWEKALDLAGLRSAPASVLDFACGNLRFEAFLAERFPSEGIDAHCIDVCSDLAACSIIDSAEAITVNFVQEDIVGSLLDAGLESDLAAIEPCDLVVCMGFMHHVPGFDNRATVLGWLGRHVKEGGALVVSFWQFMESPRLAGQAERLTRETCLARGIEPADLEDGDFFLGWQNSETARRYCHSFAKGEVERLASCALLQESFEVSYFEADGKEKRLNRYLVAKRR